MEVSAAWRVGDGPAVLLVHGWGDDNSLWAPLIDALASGVARSSRSICPATASPTVSGASIRKPATEFSRRLPRARADRRGRRSLVRCRLRGAGDTRRCGREASRSRCAIPWTRESLVAFCRAPRDVPGCRGGRTGGLRGHDRPGPRRLHLASALPALDADVLVIHSVDDEHMPFHNSQELVPRCPRAELVAVDGLTHRKTARDPEVVARITDFVSHPSR